MNESLRKRRTDANFEKHVLTESNGNALIYRFEKPNTRMGSIVFINAEGIMAVTGDYGNWIFCREFHASNDGYVSDGYWLEKLRMTSSQKPGHFDPDGTRKEIEEKMAEEDIDDEDKRYLNDLLDHLDDGEERYLVWAHDTLPQNRDHEYVPFTKKLDYWLEVIFDAFDEICRRKNENNNPN